MPGERQRYVNRDTRFHPQPCAASAESTAATAVGAPPGGRSGSPEIQRSPWGFRPAPVSSRDCIACGGAPKQSAAAAAPAVGQAIKPWAVQKRGRSAGSTDKSTATSAPMTQRACLRQAGVPAGHRKHSSPMAAAAAACLLRMATEPWGGPPNAHLGCAEASTGSSDTAMDGRPSAVDRFYVWDSAPTAMHSIHEFEIQAELAGGNISISTFS